MRVLPPPGDLDWKPKHNILIHARRDGGRVGCTPRSGKALALKSSPLSAVSEEHQRTVKTLHHHLHGDGDSKPPFEYHKKKHVEEPPGWNPTGTICASKKGLSEHFGYGNKGRTYGRSIVTSGRNYLKHHLRRFSKPEWAEPLRKILEPEIDMYHEQGWDVIP
jgi:hypothetical protein